MTDKSKQGSFKISAEDTKIQLKQVPKPASSNPSNRTTSPEPQRKIQLRPTQSTSSLITNDPHPPQHISTPPAQHIGAHSGSLHSSGQHNVSSPSAPKLGHHKLPDFSALKSNSQVARTPSSPQIDPHTTPTPQTPNPQPTSQATPRTPNPQPTSQVTPQPTPQATPQAPPQPAPQSTQTPNPQTNPESNSQPSQAEQTAPAPIQQTSDQSTKENSQQPPANQSEQTPQSSETVSPQASQNTAPIQEMVNRSRLPTIWEGGKEEEWSICTVGSQCGKSALVVRFLYDKFTDIDEPTVEDNHKREGSTFFVEGVRTTLKILDTSGSDDYASFRFDWFSRSQGFIFVFSVNSQTSFDLLPTFFDAVTNAKQTDKFPMVLVGTQLDTATPQKRAVSRKAGRDLARKFNCPYWETSAKTGENVEQVFKSIVDELRYGKKKDPFIQETPFYKTTWKELIQVPLLPEERLLNPKVAGYNNETGTSPALNFYVFPHNTVDDIESPEITTSVFEQTLQECMAKQRDRMPELPIPRILLHLIDAFYVMDGTTTEGVFRVPAFPNEVKQLKEQINLGNYHLFSIATNVHTIAALMKLWLRELTDPLIPNHYYQAAVTQPQNAKEIFKKLPELNQRVVTCLLNFLEDLCKPECVEKTKMGKDNLAMVFAPSFLRCPHTDPALIMAASEKEKDFVLELWNVVPPPERRTVAVFPHTLLFEREEKYIPYYQDYFGHEKDQVSWIGRDSTSPVIGAVHMNPIRNEWRTLIVTKENRFRFFMPACKEKEILDKIKAASGDRIQGLTKMKKPKNQKNFVKDLISFEKNEIANTYKWGVLLFKEGQDEDAMYANTTTTPAFEEFLTFLGTKVELKGFTGFRGGLDVKNNSTGTHSVYTNFHDMEIMFHVAPLLPSYPNDKQQLERKRHLGNDVVTIIFKEASTLFSPTMLKSEFNHIFVVVSEAGKGCYRIHISCKDGVPPFGPPLPFPGVFTKGPALREFLFTKLINGERAALHGCPNFKNKLVSARRVQLEQLEKEYGKKK